ncbi:MAG: hypothetical protein Unbinned8472contig1000_47 [Prokaryotic dsDNA virus sp.]|nr:MAG: hypothetical protein Unbinned8472contig1000_47 [Prokaryotic dsDNA virus sp.]
MKNFRAGWTFKQHSAKDSDYIWYCIKASSKSEAARALYRHINNHLVRIKVVEVK